MALFVLALSVAIVACGGFRLAWPFRKAPLPEAGGLLLVGAAAAALFCGRPFEMLLGGRDATTYFLGGVALSRHGTLFLPDPAVRSVGSEAIRSLMPQGPVRNRFVARRGIGKYPGFRWTDSSRRWVVSQGGHFLPAWIALCHAAGGLRAAYEANAVLGVLAVGAVFAAGSVLFGPWAAALGAMLLVLDLLEVWMARYPVAEIAVQGLLFSGFASLLYGGRWANGVGGLLLGAALFAKVDCFLLLLPLALWWRFERSRGAARTEFWAVFGILAAAAAVYWKAIHPDYSRDVLVTFVNTQKRLWTKTAGAVDPLALGASVLAVVWFAWKLRARVGGIVRRAKIGQALAVLLLAGGLYGYALRPLQWFGSNEAAHTVVWLAWYTGPVVFLGGLVGLALFLGRGGSPEGIWVVGALVFLAVVFLQLPFVNLVHIYLGRRFVPAAVPLLVLGFGFLTTLAWRTPRGFARAMAAALAGLAWFAAAADVAARSRHVYGHREYPGLERQFASLVPRLAKADLVLTHDRWIEALVAPALEWLYDVPTVPFRTKAFADHGPTLEQWLSSGRTLVVLTRPRGLAGVAGAEEFDPLDERLFETRHLEPVRGRFPDRIGPLRLALATYGRGERLFPVEGLWRRRGPELIEALCPRQLRWIAGDPFLLRRLRRSCPAEGQEAAILAATEDRGRWEDWLRLHGADFASVEVGGVVLFHGIVPRPGAGEAHRLPTTGWILEASGSADPWKALDGDLQTRWASGTPRAPGMTFAIGFPEPIDLEWLRLRMGPFAHDRSGRFAVETSPDGETWTRVEIPQAELGLVWRDGSPEVSRHGDTDLRLGSRGVRWLRLVNLDRSPRFDWSIAELVLEGAPVRESRRGGAPAQR
jgi:hypothetical protein